MDLARFLRDWRRVGKAEVDMEVGGRGGGGAGGGRGGGGEEGEEGEGEGGQQNWSCGKKKSTIAMPGAGSLLLFWGLQKASTLCGPVFVLFLIRVL